MIKVKFDDFEKDQEIYYPELTTEEKCQFCINCDIDGSCIAKREAPFNSFVCEHNEMFEPYEE